MNDEKLLTPEQVAERLQVTVQTIYTWMRSGYLPSVKMGRLWRIRPSDLDEFIKQQKHRGQ
ncbi:MAG: helix-turn-helix domain-containing protein [Ktedonobacteraceae bacterium]|nr:helix-turn-helix domain-containing protein [Ktedonobacteraceae bacterium]